MPGQTKSMKSFFIINIFDVYMAVRCVTFIVSHIPVKLPPSFHTSMSCRVPHNVTKSPSQNCGSAQAWVC